MQGAWWLCWLVAGVGLLGACTEDGAAPPTAPDGGVPPDGPYARVDLAEVRGAPLALRPLGARRGAAVEAVTRDGFVLREGCDPARGCTFSFHTRAGEPLHEERGLAYVHGGPFSPTRDQAVAMRLERVEPCTVDDRTYERRVGALRLFDLGSGSSTSLVEAASLHDVLEGAFLPSGEWIRTYPLPPGGCGDLVPRVLAARPPHGASGVSGDVFEVVDERADGTWAGFVPGTDTYALVDPHDGGSLRPLVHGGQGIETTRGWSHAYEGWPLSAVVSVDPEGREHRWPIDRATIELFPEASSGAVVVLCGLADAAGRVACRARAMDGRGTEARFGLAVDGPRALATLSGSGRLVYVDRDAAGRYVEVLDLATGEVTPLADGDAALHVFGDDEAAVVVDAQQRAWLVHGDHVELVGERVAFVQTVGPRGARPLLPQSHLAVVVSLPPEWGDPALLDVIDARSRRIVRLSDDLAFARPPEGAFSTGCGVPWLARSAGSPRETLRAPSPALFFLELPEPGEGPDATLTLVPTDLSAPPRALARMYYADCMAPMLSRDGSFAVVDVTRHPDGRALFAAEWAPDARVVEARGPTSP